MSDKRKRRAARGSVHLATTAAGYFAIAWPRTIALTAGIPRLESLGTRDRIEAEGLLRRRQLDVLAAVGDEGQLRELRSRPIPLAVRPLASAFLVALRDGQAPPTPSPASIATVYVSNLLGVRGGLVTFAERSNHAAFDAALVERWLDAERQRGAAADTLRLKLCVARRLARWACDAGNLSEAVSARVQKVKRPRGVMGRAKADGVPQLADVFRVLRAMSPPHWQAIAECQLRLGLRRSEVLALTRAWVDVPRGVLRVRIGSAFRSKDSEERIIHADPTTLELAIRVAALLPRTGACANGYRMAWKRALGKTGIPWPYRAKSHALRQCFATFSVAQGIPLSRVADEMGHSTTRVTEQHYIGRVIAPTARPFADVPLVSSDDKAAPAPSAAAIVLACG